MRRLTENIDCRVDSFGEIPLYTKSALTFKKILKQFKNKPLHFYKPNTRIIIISFKIFEAVYMKTRKMNSFYLLKVLLSRLPDRN